MSENFNSLSSFVISFSWRVSPCSQCPREMFEINQCRELKGIGTLVECKLACVVSFKYDQAYRDACIVGWSITILDFDKFCAIRIDLGV